MTSVSTVLITINVQNDFCAGGVYPLKDAADRIRVINNLREHADIVIHARLVLQPNHYSFRSSNPGSELGDILKRPLDVSKGPASAFRRGSLSKARKEMKECIVNPYCVRGTTGAAYHPDLIVNEHDVVMEHGFDPSSGNLSLFNLKIHDKSILASHFKKAEVNRILIAGFGYEYSVLQTALEACHVRPNNGQELQTIVVADACCPCDFVMGMDQVADKILLNERGVSIMSSYEIPSTDDVIPVDPDSQMDEITADIQWRTELHRLAADTSHAGTRAIKNLAESDLRRHNPFALDWFGNSPLIVAAQCRNTPAISAILVMLSHATSTATGEGKTGAADSLTHRLKRKTRLLKHVNHQGLHGMTALMWAASLHDLRGVKALLRHGALPTKGLSLGNQNSMIFATSMHLSNHAFAIVRELVKACSKSQAAGLFTVQDTRGWTAFHFASLNGLLGDLDLTLLYPQGSGSTAPDAASTKSPTPTRRRPKSGRPKSGKNRPHRGSDAGSRRGSTTSNDSSRSGSVSSARSGSNISLDIPQGSSTDLVLATKEHTAHLVPRVSSKRALKVSAVTSASPAESPHHVDVEKGLGDTKVTEKQQKKDGWKRPSLDPLHGGAKLSDILNGKAVSGRSKGIPLEARTHDKFTPLHLAAWSGANASVVALLDLASKADSGKPAFDASQHMSRFVNATVDGFTPLDLMIQEGHSHCIPILLKQNSFAKRYRGDRCTELLHRSILFGDQSTAERILQFDENEVETNGDVIRLVDSLEHVYPASCTSTFAKASNDDDESQAVLMHGSTTPCQYMYRCVKCDHIVCLVCWERCHKDHGEVERLGSVPRNEYGPCGCDKTSCLALGAASIREMEGYRYDPSPVDTNNLDLDPSLASDALSDRTTPLGRLAFDLARNSHEVWAKQRQEDGWRYGSTRDDAKKIHPSLRPFGQLTDRDRSYNESAAREAIRVVHSFAFSIVPDDGESDGRRSTIASRRMRMRRRATSGHPSRPASGRPSLAATHAHSIGASMGSMASALGSMASLLDEPVDGRKTPESAVEAGSPDQVSKLERLDSAATTAGAESNSNHDGNLWLASPVNTRHVYISHTLSNLIELLAKNDHDVWAKSKIDMGWRYSPGKVQEKSLTTPMLVPYEMLSTTEKSRLRQSAVEMVKIVIHSGFKITCTNPTVSGTVIRRLRERERHMLSGKGSHGGSEADSKKSEDLSKLTQFKVAVRTALLMRAARSGHGEAVKVLLERLPKSSVNHCDHFKHTPLYLAVKRGHSATVEVLLQHKADATFTDINQLTPLSVASQLGNAAMCDLLIRLTKQLADEHPLSPGSRSRTSSSQDLLRVQDSQRNVARGQTRSSLGSAFGSRLTDKQRGQKSGQHRKSSAIVLTCDRWGLSPLHRAACLNHTDVCRVIVNELTSIKDMDVDLTQLAQVNRVLSMMKKSAGRAMFGGMSTPKLKSPKSTRGTPTAPAGAKRRSMMKTMSARDLVTAEGETARSAFVRGMQNLTQRLFGKKPRLSRPVTPNTPKVSPMKVTTHELVALQEQQKEVEAARGLWKTVRKKAAGLPKQAKEGAIPMSSAASTPARSQAHTMQQDIDRIGVGIFAPTTPLGMATCLRCLDVVRFLVAHGADPTLTTPIKIYRTKRKDSLFNVFKRGIGAVDEPRPSIQNHGMSPYQVALFVYHELRMIRQTIENQRGNDTIQGDSESSVVKSLDVNIDMASQMIDLLNEAAVTKSVRDWFAVRKCSGGIIPNLLMWVLLLSASPSFYDGYLHYESFVFARELEETFNTALSTPGLTSNDPFVWLEYWRQDPSIAGLFNYEQGSSHSNGTTTSCRVQYNYQSSYLVGPLQFQIRKFQRADVCSAASDQRWFGRVNYPAITEDSLPNSCFKAFGGHMQVPHREDLDGEKVWYNMEYSCGSGGITWENWDAETTITELLGMNSSMTVGGELHGTAAYYDELRSVSDVQIRGLLYHPDLNRFVTVDMTSQFQPSGAVNILTMAKSAQFEGRFPPSIEFEFVVILVMAMAIFESHRAMTRKDGVYDSVSIKGDTLLERVGNFLKRVWGYLLLDATLAAVAAALCGFDIYILVQMSSLGVMDLTNRSSGVEPVFNLMDLVVGEQSFIGLIVFMVGFRLVKYLRFLPVCGPEIISIVMTVFHREVLLYISVVCLVLALFSISGQLVFTTWVDLTTSTFIRIFNLNFAEKKNDFFNDAAPRVEEQVIVMAMYLFYLIFALVALNLFIGLITDWYPKIRTESHRQWHYILTREMAYSVYNTFSFRCNGVGTMNRQGLYGQAPTADPTKLESVCFKAAVLVPISQESLLRGMDGEKYWRKNAIQRPGRRRVDSDGRPTGGLKGRVAVPGMRTTPGMLAAPSPSNGNEDTDEDGSSPNRSPITPTQHSKLDRWESSASEGVDVLWRSIMDNDSLENLQGAIDEQY